MGVNHIDQENGHLNPLEVRRLYEPDEHAMLAALRVILRLPRVIPASGQDDLLSDGS